MLLALARSGQAPRIFGWVNSRGVPVPSLLYVQLFLNIRNPPLILADLRQPLARRLLRDLPHDDLGRGRRLHLAAEPHGYLLAPRLGHDRPHLPPLPRGVEGAGPLARGPALHAAHLPHFAASHDRAHRSNVRRAGVCVRRGGAVQRTGECFHPSSPLYHGRTPC